MRHDPRIAVTSFDPSPVRPDVGAIVVELAPRLLLTSPNIQSLYRQFSTDNASKQRGTGTIVMHPHDWATHGEGTMPNLGVAGVVFVATSEAWRDTVQAMALTPICRTCPIAQSTWR